MKKVWFLLGRFHVWFFRRDWGFRCARRCGGGECRGRRIFRCIINRFVGRIGCNGWRGSSHDNGYNGWWVRWCGLCGAVNHNHGMTTSIRPDFYRGRDNRCWLWCPIYCYNNSISRLHKQSKEKEKDCC